MKTNKSLTMALLITASLSTQGCMVAAIGAGVGAVKWSNAKKHQAYNDYVINMQRINMEREEHHLKPQPVLSYAEYLNTQEVKSYQGK